jgi:precorrin-6B methylase 2
MTEKSIRPLLSGGFSLVCRDSFHAATMNFENIFKALRSRLRDEGLRGVGHALQDRCYVRWSEWRLGIHSEAVIDLKEFGIRNELFRPYVPTDYRSFQTILAGLKIRPNEDVFLDFGSGMGRAVIMAAKYPFRKIYGVEIAPQLNEIARQNVRSAPRLKCRDIELVTANAREFVIPDEITMIYFFNPFGGEVLAEVLQNIRASLRRLPRTLRLICKIPARSAFEEEIIKHTWLIKEREIIFDTNSRYLFLTVHDKEG